MKFFLISDNAETVTGMRLAGIDGVVVHEPDEIEHALNHAMDDKEIAIVLMTAKCVGLIEQTVNTLKRERPSPLIAEIPDRHADIDVTSSISRYVHEAIGISI